MLADETVPFSEPPIANKREIRGLYFASLGHGPVASVLIIFVQLLIVKQTKYLASQNSQGENWIEWREKFADGKLCNGTGMPFPKDAEFPYARPEGYSEDCLWFPSDPHLPGIGIQYTNAIVYGTTSILFMTGLLLLILGPFSDYGHYRRQLLIGCLCIWIPVLSLMFLIRNPELYYIAIALTAVGFVTYAFGLRSPLASYLPLLINNSHELVDLKAKIQYYEKEKQSRRSVVIEMVPFEPETEQNKKDREEHSTRPSQKEGTERSENEAPTAGLIKSEMSSSDELSLKELRNAYQDRYEAVAGKMAMRESAYFIAGQLSCLVIQFGLIWFLSDEDDPKHTLGERSAILVSTVWALIFCILGIRRLKDREGPPFPPGNQFMIGAKRSIKTFKLLYQKLPRLLSLMIGRMFFWLSMQTVMTMSTLFFEKEFAMTAIDLAPAILLYLAVGIPSALATAFIIQKASINILRIFQVFCLLVMCLPFYILFGVQNRFEVYVLMGVSSLFMAPFSALVRAMMADLIPQGYSATIMSFEGLLENCTTWIGPLIVGGLLDLTDSIRFSLFSLEVFCLMGLPFVLFVSLQKGRDQKRMAENTS